MASVTAVQPVTLERIKARNVKLPVCPSVFAKLTQVLASSTSTSRDLSQVITLDPALTGEVLKVANSAFYGMSRNVRSVEDAIFRLGFREVGAIASALNSKQMFTNGATWSAFNKKLWEHSMLTAMIARAMGARLNQQTADIFFTAGLLHDIGKLVFQQLDAKYVERALDGMLHGMELSAQERASYGTSHAAIGGELLASWSLPAPIVRLVENHHIDPLADREHARMRGSFALANELAHDANWDPSKGLWTLGRMEPVQALLALLNVQLEELLAIRKKAVEQAKAVLG